MGKSQFTDKDYNLWVKIAQLRHGMFIARRKELAQYGISPRQAAVLFVTEAIGDEATPAEISRWLFRQPHSISWLLNQMEKGGLIRKSKDLDRKNQVRIELTEKGQKAHSDIMRRESIHEIMSSLSDEESQQLSIYLQKLFDKVLKKIEWEVEIPFPPRS